MKITDMPAEFCRQRCNAWNHKLERCDVLGERICQHPEREDAWKHKEKPRADPGR